jgi:hypothetical protein
MPSHVIIESIYILEHFQKDVMAVGKNGATDGYPLVLSEYRLLLGLLPIAVLNEPSGTFPYVFTHDLSRTARGCILISCGLRQASPTRTSPLPPTAQAKDQLLVVA